MSQRMACKVYGIPRCTLHMRLSGKTELGAKPGNPTKLSFDEEQKLVDYAGNRVLDLVRDHLCSMSANLLKNMAQNF